MEELRERVAVCSIVIAFRPVKAFARLLLILAMAALPLRGVAVAWGPPHGMEAGAGHEGCLDTMQGMQQGAGGPAEEPASGHCAACPIGAPALPAALVFDAAAAASSFAIPFTDRHTRAPVPVRLERPPLAL